MASCFSLFCQVNQHELPAEWRDDLNNNPGGKGGETQLGDLPRVPDTAAIGHLHLSFEYHKTNLKIRVWQISDLLLPPPQISMIESIFVRSYLIPDPVKKTNRKTEDVRVDTSNKRDMPKNSPLQSGIQHIFTPSSFRFETPLLYAGVTKAIVDERSVRLEVCMTQKQTHRAFLMAIVHMPLIVAVRRPIRERYPLIPCMNYTIPNNMRVYSARDIILEGAGSGSISSRAETLSRSNSSICSSVTSRDGASSVASQKFVSLDLSDSDDEAGEVVGILEIQTTSPVRKPSTPPVVRHPSPGKRKPESGRLREVTSGESSIPADNVSIDISNQDVEGTPKVKRKIIPNEILPGKKDLKISSSSDESSTVRSGHSSSTVVDIGSLENDTVVDITKLQRDVVLDLDQSSHTISKDMTNISMSSGNSKKKKIMPPSELLSQTVQKLNLETQESPSISSLGDDGGLSSASDSGCVYDDIASELREKVTDTTTNNTADAVHEPEHQGHLGSSDPKSDLQEGSLSIDRTASRLNSSSRLAGSVSEVNSEIGSTTTSRPETPVWDFYDFADEEAAEQGTEGHTGEDGNSGSGGVSAGDGDAASKALGTLQESILRLSRSTRLGAGGNNGVLETERVTGPVLPTVMIEDFEEMEEPVEDEDEPVNVKGKNVEDTNTKVEEHEIVSS